MATIEVKADITGSIWKVLKTVGDSVEEDEAIVIMESMKMEIPVSSPRAGVLRELKVKEGDTVENGMVLALVEP